MEVVDHVEDAPVRAVLERLVALFALTEINDGQQWTGIVDGRLSLLIDTAVGQLLEELRPDAAALVDSFGLSDNVLKESALGRSDGNVYEALYEAATKSRLNEEQPFRGYKVWVCCCVVATRTRVTCCACCCPPACDTEAPAAPLGPQLSQATQWRHSRVQAVSLRPAPRLPH